MTVEPWSADVLIDRLGADEALARELAGIFLADSPRMMGALQEAVATGTSDDVRRAAHAVKGSAANFTDDGPVPAALALEMLAREGRTQDYAAALAHLEREMRRFIEQLERFVRS